MGKGIATLLKITGFIFVGIGIIGGIVTYSNVDKEGYETAKEVYDELLDNEFAEASYNTAKQIYIAEISYVLSITLGGIVSGLLLLGFGTLIDLSRLRYEKDEQIYDLLLGQKKVDS